MGWATTCCAKQGKMVRHCCCLHVPRGTKRTKKLKLLNDLFKRPRHLVQQSVESMLKQINVETVKTGLYSHRRATEPWYFKELPKTTSPQTLFFQNFNLLCSNFTDSFLHRFLNRWLEGVTVNLGTSLICAAVSCSLTVHLHQLANCTNTPETKQIFLCMQFNAI